MEGAVEIEGFLGNEIWLDPEANSFVRLHYGAFDRFQEVVSNMIQRAQKDYAALPSNFHLSVRVQKFLILFGIFLGNFWKIFGTFGNFVGYFLRNFLIC